ncbi:MAG: glycosyltransferase family 4 protein [bacterium]|nr:glycosyltransferase family 4 protein [bacterium]
MKILYFITKSNWGGAQRHIYDLAVSMKNEGHDVAVALGGDGILRTRLEAAGIYTHSVSKLSRDISAGNDFASLRQIFSIIRHRRPDILHVHSPKAAGLGAFAGRILGVSQIIFTVHGWSFNESRPLYQRSAIVFVSWLTMLLCNKTILLSEREYTQALHFPGVKNKITLIPLGIKPPIFLSIDGAKVSLAKHIGMQVSDFNKKIVIGTIAELHPNKGLSYLIQSFASVVTEHPQAILVIIGDGEQKAQLQTLTQELKLEQHVFFTGYMDHAAEYLKAFTVFALSSLKEGLPYVILESGCASLPVVATTVGGIPEIVEDMRSGVLVQAKNIRELSHALSFMIEHPEERRTYAIALKERVLTKFSLEKMIESTKELYKKDN